MSSNSSSWPFDPSSYSLATGSSTRSSPAASSSSSASTSAYGESNEGTTPNAASNASDNDGDEGGKSNNLIVGISKLYFPSFLARHICSCPALHSHPDHRSLCPTLRRIHLPSTEKAQLETTTRIPTRFRPRSPSPDVHRRPFFRSIHGYRRSPSHVPSKRFSSFPLPPVRNRLHSFFQLSFELYDEFCIDRFYFRRTLFRERWTSSEIGSRSIRSKFPLHPFNRRLRFKIFRCLHL